MRRVATARRDKGAYRYGLSADEEYTLMPRSRTHQTTNYSTRLHQNRACSVGQLLYTRMDSSDGVNRDHSGHRITLCPWLELICVGCRGVC